LPLPGPVAQVPCPSRLCAFVIRYICFAHPGAFCLSACALLVFSRTVTRSISQWCNINSAGRSLDEGGSSHGGSFDGRALGGASYGVEEALIVASLRRQVVRLNASSGALVAAYLLRAAVWSCSTFGYFGPVPL